MNLELEGKHALVLGGGKGLGAAIAQALGAEGAIVTTVSRSDKGPAESLHIAADLDEPEAPQAILEELDRHGRSVDILVLNSGGPPIGRAQDVEPAGYTQVMQRMFLAQVSLAQAVLPRMKEHGFGRILAIGSTSVVAPIGGLVMSNAIRSALASWCKTLAAEVAGAGVTVNLILPGMIETDRLAGLRKARAEQSGRDEADLRDAQLAGIPMRRFGKPEEFGDAAAFLASPRSAYITGTALRIDGGMTGTL